MISREEVLQLAALSRLELSEKEITGIEADMSSILAYVDKLKKVSGNDPGPVFSSNLNVMREDGNAHQGGKYTKGLVEAAPESAGGFVKVKKILGQSQ